MNNGVGCVPHHHRRCISSWLIEFIIRYWKSEKASKTSAHVQKQIGLRKAAKFCALCKMHKRRFSNWAPPHSLSVLRPKYGGWWISGKSGNFVQICPRQNLLQSCWLDSDCWRRNIQNGQRLTFLLKLVIFRGVHLETIYSWHRRKQRFSKFNHRAAQHGEFNSGRQVNHNAESFDV